jgi:hypothetical protein
VIGNVIRKVDPTEEPVEDSLPMLWCNPWALIRHAEDRLRSLRLHLNRDGRVPAAVLDVIVVDIGDGLAQDQTVHRNGDALSHTVEVRLLAPSLREKSE